MADYKDITTLKKQIADVKRAVISNNSDCLTGYISALSAVEDIIAGLPEADVQEVRHGYWRRAVAEKYGNAYCSECNHFDWNDGIFCSNCGTKMDLKNGGEE